MDTDKSIPAYFGHHKAATTWMIQIINAICMEIGIHHMHFHSAKMFDFDLVNTLKDKKVDFLSYTNAEMKYVKPILADVKGFHLIRDPRDVVVSAYFSHLYSHSDKHWPELQAHRDKLRALSKDEGLMLIIDEVDNIQLDGSGLNALKNLYDWDYSLSNILEVKYEDLIVNPYSGMLDILGFLGLIEETDEVLHVNTSSLFKALVRRLISQLGARFLLPSAEQRKINPHKVLSFVYMHEFKKITKGRKPGEEDVRHHFRQGKSGDWVNHFNDDHKKRFKQKYNDLLIKLQYVDNDSW